MSRADLYLDRRVFLSSSFDQCSGIIVLLPLLVVPLPEV